VFQTSTTQLPTHFLTPFFDGPNPVIHNTFCSFREDYLSASLSFAGEQEIQGELQRHAAMFKYYP
jgi:hypothetical protein